MDNLDNRHITSKGYLLEVRGVKQARHKCSPSSSCPMLTEPCVSTPVAGQLSHDTKIIKKNIPNIHCKINKIAIHTWLDWTADGPRTQTGFRSLFGRPFRQRPRKINTHTLYSSFFMYTIYVHSESLSPWYCCVRINLFDLILFEHVLTGLVDARTCTQGCSPWPPPFPWLKYDLHPHM